MDLILRNIYDAKLCDVLWYYPGVTQKFAVLPDSTEEWTWVHYLRQFCAQVKTKSYF